VNSKDEKENDPWWKNRRIIKLNIHKGIRSRKKFVRFANGIRGDLDASVSQAEDEIDKLRILDEIYGYEGSGIDLGSVFEGSIDSIVYNSRRDASTWDSLSRDAERVRNETESIMNTINASGSMVPSITSGTYYIIAERTEPGSHFYKYTNRLNSPSSLDRRRELSAKLHDIDPYLDIRLNGAWQTIEDGSKQDRISQASTSVRELITNLLNKFAPHKDVKKAWWYKQHPDVNNATRKQRIRYAIMGNNKNTSKKELENIIELVDNLYYEFDKLNKMTHQQREKKELEAKTKEIIDQCQIHLSKMIELREMYFE